MTDEPIGDLPIDDFRRYGHEIVDWIAQYLEESDRYPVLSRVSPGEICEALPTSAPTSPEPIAEILHDFETVVMPGITHWNHPGFLAYFAVTGSIPGILGEFLAAALNVNGMLWRTSPAASELEEVSLGWLRQLMGLPNSFEGVIYDTASISSLVAIAAAREATGLPYRVQGGSGLPRLRLYCSDQAHSSIEKDAITLGIGQENVRKIPTDAEFRLDVSKLRAAIDEDLAGGFRPFCVVATAGTTSTTSVDPIPAIAEICEMYDLWLHVDAAYGGAAAILPEKRWVLEGAERADSLVMNPHKWLFTPVDLSAFFSPRLDTVHAAFSLVPEYLRTGESQVRNYMDYGPQLGRRFRALKLWFVLRAFGQEGLRARIREHIRLAQEFAGWVDASPDWERLAPVPLSVVCFRAEPAGVPRDALDDLNQRILDEVNERGRVYLSHTRLNSNFALRIAIGNLRTDESYVQMAWEELRTCLQSLCSAAPLHG
ncbi:MAG TPA: pyridoxal-dependent decarboxylase [Chloroflexota bacterium]|nr:pyridoxal-dependent decarboxylase [Chloroflexota bacterium]